MGPPVVSAALAARATEVVVVGHCRRDHCMSSVAAVRSDGSHRRSCWRPDSAPEESLGNGTD